MPATHRVQIVKRFNLDEWSNDWLVEATDMDDAVATGNALVTLERHFHGNNITLEYMRVSQNNPLTRVFRHVPINLAGLVDMSGSEWLPLFNTMRVDMQTADSDPGRKYFRVPIPEGWQTNGQLSATQVTAMNGVLTTYLFGSVAGDNIYTPKGHLVIAATVYPYVQMRQLHRRRHKKPA